MGTLRTKIIDCVNKTLGFVTLESRSVNLLAFVSRLRFNFEYFLEV